MPAQGKNDDDLGLDTNYVVELLKRDAAIKANEYKNKGASVYTEPPAKKPITTNANKRFLKHLLHDQNSHNRDLLEKERKQSNKRLRHLDKTVQDNLQKPKSDEELEAADHKRQRGGGHHRHNNRKRLVDQQLEHIARREKLGFDGSQLVRQDPTYFEQENEDKNTSDVLVESDLRVSKLKEELNKRLQWSSNSATRSSVADLSSLYSADPTVTNNSSGSKSSDDVEWPQYGKGPRDWDKGKVVDKNGLTNTKPDWK